MKSNNKINQNPYEVKWGPWQRYIKVEGGDGGSLQLGLAWVVGGSVMMVAVRLVQIWEICLKSTHISKESTQSAQNHHPKLNWNCKPKIIAHSQIQIE